MPLSQMQSPVGCLFSAGLLILGEDGANAKILPAPRTVRQRDCGRTALLEFSRATSAQVVEAPTLPPRVGASHFLDARWGVLAAAALCPPSVAFAAPPAPRSPPHKLKSPPVRFLATAPAFRSSRLGCESGNSQRSIDPVALNTLHLKRFGRITVEDKPPGRLEQCKNDSPAYCLLAGRIWCHLH
jgi:hypothetical protein